MSLQGTRVLVTGGAGFIGSHVGEALLREGAALTVIDNLDDFYSPEAKQANLTGMREAGPFEFAQVDICDPQAIRDAVARANPEIVIHLAARPGVGPSQQQPGLYERTNVAGALNVLEACRNRAISRFVFGSSSSIYGGDKPAPFREDDADLRPLSPYAATKLAGEAMCHVYAHLYALPIICLRFFTVYGPRQRPDLAIHKFTALIESGKPVPIYGDGSSSRDYTHVRDIAAGVLSAASCELGGVGQTRFDVVNLGNSHPVRLSDLIDLLGRVTGREVSIERRPAQPGDAPLTWADITRAERVLGYRPRVPFEDGLREFVNWYRATVPKI